MDAAVCFYCGARRPGLWGFGPLAGRLIGRLDFAHAVTIACVVAFVASILLDPRAAMSVPRSPFDLLSPSHRALVTLGMTGELAWRQGWWWTLVTAVYLHGSLLHLVFNLLWVRQLAPAVEELFGTTRLAVVFTASGIAGCVLSNVASGAWVVGASGAVFGLLGAMVAYGRSRGGAFGAAVLQQYGRWALLMFVFGFFMIGVSNWGHAGGFVGGYLSALALGHRERAGERGLDRAFALGAIGLTLAAFAFAVWNGIHIWPILFG